MRIVTLLVAAFIAVPAVHAGPQPALLFLADGESPLSDGTLSTDYPQGNESKARPILPEIDGPLTWFIAEAADADRLRGRLFVGLWTDSSVVVEGNVSATLILRTADNDTLIATASRSLNVDPSMVPDPVSLIPPDPTDPEGAALHIAGKVLPLVLRPPMLLDLGMVDIELPANATLVLGLGLIAPDGSQLPISAGAATVKYGAALSPSFVYAPWYKVDPPGAPPATPPGGTTTGSPPPSGTPAPTSSEAPAAKDTPAAGLLMTGVALAAALWVARRRS